MEITKRCTKCREEKSILKFYKDTRKKDGYRFQCKDCSRKYRQENANKISIHGKNYRKLNSEKISDYKKKQHQKNKDIKKLEYQQNPEPVKQRMKQYYQKNKQKINKQARKYQINNPHIINALCAKRHAAKLKATPPWLAEAHYAEIAAFYKQAKEMETKTGIKHHVDHIIPLQGKNVCGLHVSWNLQILTAQENLSKGNKTSPV